MGRLVGRVKLKYIRNTYSLKGIRDGWVDSWVKGRKGLVDGGWVSG